MSITLRPPEGSRQEGTGFSRCTPLKGAQAKVNCPPQPPGSATVAAGQPCLRSGPGNRLQKRSPGALGTQNWLQSSGVSLLQAHRPQDRDQGCPKRWPWARGSWRPAGGAPLSSASLSVHAGDSRQSGRQGDGVLQARGWYSVLSLAKTPEGHVLSLGNSWPPSRAHCCICSPGLCLQVQAHHLKAAGLCGSSMSPRPQLVKCRRRGAPGLAHRGAGCTEAARGPTLGPGSLAASHAHKHTDTHTSRGLGDTGSTAAPGSKVGAPGRGQGLTSGPGRAPPGPPSRAGTWPGPSWSPVQPPGCSCPPPPGAGGPGPGTA